MSKSKRVQISFDDPSLTHQSFKDECNIRNIMNQYKRTGFLPSVPNLPLSGDFSMVPDFLDALTFVRDAQESFDSLPAIIRKRFNNDPAAFLDFVQDEQNRDEAIRLGMINALDNSVPNSTVAEPVGEADPSST